MLGIALPFVCPCAVLHPRGDDMRPACWKQSCDTVISRWSTKAWEHWTVPFQIPTQERRSMTWMFQNLRKPSPGLTPGTMQNWLAFRETQKFLYNAPNILIWYWNDLREIRFLCPIRYSGLAAETLAFRIPKQALFSDLYHYGSICAINENTLFSFHWSYLSCSITLLLPATETILDFWSLFSSL